MLAYRRASNSETHRNCPHRGRLSRPRGETQRRTVADAFVSVRLATRSRSTGIRLFGYRGRSQTVLGNALAARECLIGPAAADSSTDRPITGATVAGRSRCWKPSDSPGSEQGPAGGHQTLLQLIEFIYFGRKKKLTVGARGVHFTRCIRAMIFPDPALQRGHSNEYSRNRPDRLIGLWRPRLNVRT